MWGAHYHGNVANIGISCLHSLAHFIKHFARLSVHKRLEKCPKHSHKNVFSFKKYQSITRDNFLNICGNFKVKWHWCIASLLADADKQYLILLEHRICFLLCWQIRSWVVYKLAVNDDVSWLILKKWKQEAIL